MTYIGHPDFQDITQPQGPGDLLFQLQVPVGQKTQSVQSNITTGQYQRFWISGFSSNTTDVTATIIEQFNQATYQSTTYTPAGGLFQAALPADGVVGTQSIIFEIALGVNSVGPGDLYSLWGMRYVYDGLRLDGRMPCQGQFIAGVPGTAGPNTVIAAPTSPNRLLIGHIHCPPGLNSAASTGVTHVNGTMHGVSVALAASVWSQTTFAGEDLQDSGGLLLDVGSALIQTSGIATFTGSQGLVTYDIVQ
jgi:hypothetical protein